MGKEGDRNFSPQEQGRLKAFGHILGRAHEAEVAIDAGRRLEYQWQAVGQPPEPIFSMDQGYVDKLKGMAFDIYDSDFADNPQLKDVAGAMVDSFHGARVHEQELEPGKEASLKKLLGE